MLVVTEMTVLRHTHPLGFTPYLVGEVVKRGFALS